MNTGIKKYAWITLALLAVCHLFAYADRTVISLFVDAIKHDLALTDLELGYILGPAVAIFFSILGIPLGRLADSTNRRNLISITVAIWGICTTLSGLAQNFAVLFLARIGVGIGEAALTPSAYSMLGDLFPRHRRGLALALFMTGATLGSGVAFVGGGKLFGFFSHHGVYQSPFGALSPWQMTLITAGLPGILLALVVRFAIREPVREPIAQRPALMLALRYLWKERQFYLPVLAISATLSTLMNGFAAWSPTFFERTFDMTPSAVGSVFGPVVLVAGVIGPPLFGFLSDYLYRRGGVLASIQAVGVLFVLIFVVGQFAFRSPVMLHDLIAGLVLMLFMMGIMALGPIAMQIVAPPQMRGQITSIQLLCSTLIGLGLGPVIVPALSTYVFKGGGLGPAMTWYLSLLAGIGLILTLFVRIPSHESVGAQADRGLPREGELDRLG